MIGIYKITNLINGKFYIGKSVNIESRWKDHQYKLSVNKHENNYLQHSYNKNGKENLLFEVLVECKEDQLEDYETNLILLTESFKKEIGYNLKIGGKGGRLAEETKIKMSNSRLGKRHSNTTKSALSIKATGRRKHSKEVEQNIIDNWNTLNITKSDLSKIVRVSESTVLRILRRNGIA